MKLYLLDNMGLKHHSFIQQNTYAIIFKKYLPMISPPSYMMPGICATKALSNHNLQIKEIHVTQTGNC